MSYEAVLELSHDPKVLSNYAWKNVNWLEVLKICYEVAMEQNGKSFGIKMVTKKVGWLPGLGRLRHYGILKRDDWLSNKRETWWTIPDIDGVARALCELGYL